MTKTKKRFQMTFVYMLLTLTLFFLITLIKLLLSVLRETGQNSSILLYTEVGAEPLADHVTKAARSDWATAFLRPCSLAKATSLHRNSAFLLAECQTKTSSLPERTL